MAHNRMTGRRRKLLIGLVAVVTVAIGGSALAAQLAENVKTFTGCLASGDGVIVKVKEGTAPKSACSSGQTLVRISGGDITKLTVTGGLTGGGDNGDITIGLDPAYSLPQSCTAGKIAEWNGTAWICGTDNDTTYTDGTGLDLSGTQFSIAPAYRVKNTPDCDADRFATGFDGDGDIQCGAPPAPRSHFEPQADPNVVVKDDYVDQEVVRLRLPAGRYVLSASGEIAADTAAGRAEGSCWLGTPASLDSQDFADDNELSFGVPVSLHTIVTLSGEGSVFVQCKAFPTFDQALASDFEVVAIQVR
jgi:hypothetical protein